MHSMHTTALALQHHHHLDTPYAVLVHLHCYNCTLLSPQTHTPLKLPFYTGFSMLSSYNYRIVLPTDCGHIVLYAVPYSMQLARHLETLLFPALWS